MYAGSFHGLDQAAFQDVLLRLHWNDRGVVEIWGKGMPSVPFESFTVRDLWEKRHPDDDGGVPVPAGAFGRPLPKGYKRKPPSREARVRSLCDDLMSTLGELGSYYWYEDQPQLIDLFGTLHRIARFGEAAAASGIEEAVEDWATQVATIGVGALQSLSVDGDDNDIDERLDGLIRDAQDTWTSLAQLAGNGDDEKSKQ